MICIQAPRNGIRGSSKRANGAPVRPQACRNRRQRRSMMAPNLLAHSPLGNFFDLNPSDLFDPEDFMGTERARKIAVDFIEDSNGFQIKADIPGVSKSDIKLDVDGYVITISASRSETTDNRNIETSAEADSADSKDSGRTESPEAGSEDKGEIVQSKPGEGEEVTVLRFERYDSFISRSIRMPKTADLSTISARYENGVLTVDVQKTSDVRTSKRMIDIS